MSNDLGMMITFIILANVIALGILYAFTRRQDGKQRLLTIAFSYVAMYVVSLIVYALSGIGMDAVTHDALAITVPLILVPINVIFIMPFFFKWLAKYQSKDMSAEVFKKRMILLILGMIILCVAEFFYSRDIQKNTSEIAKRNSVNGSGINAGINENINGQNSNAQDGIKGGINSPMVEDANVDLNSVNGTIVNGVNDTNAINTNTSVNTGSTNSVNSSTTNSTAGTNQQKITYQVVTGNDEVKNVSANGTVQEDNSGRVY